MVVDIGLQKALLFGLQAFKLSFALTKHWAPNRCMYAVMMSVMGEQVYRESNK